MKERQDSILEGNTSNDETKNRLYLLQIMMGIGRGYNVSRR